MTEGKHTPGPWKFEPGHSVVVISGGDGRRIGAVDRASYYQSYSEQDLIDARLIAAAPDMLGVLLEALAIYNARDRIATLDRAGYRRDEERESLERRCDEWLAKRRDAIAKATGAS